MGFLQTLRADRRGTNGVNWAEKIDRAKEARLAGQYMRAMKPCPLCGQDHKKGTPCPTKEG